MTRAHAAFVVAILGAVAGCARPLTPPAPPTPPAPSIAAIDSLVRPWGDSSAAAVRRDLGSWRPTLGPPRASGDGVDWTPRGSLDAEPLVRRWEALGARGEPLRFWSALADSGALVPYALRRVAALALERADTAAADGALGRLAAIESLWQWEALRARAELLSARGRFAFADSMLEATDREGWPELERAAWLLRRTRLRAEMGDGARAVELGRQLVRRYPGLAPATAGAALVESELARQGRTPTMEDELAAVRVATLRGSTRDAAVRLERALRREPGHLEIAVELGESLRRQKRFGEALKVLQEAERGADSITSVPVRLEIARVHRDAGRLEPALAAYARVAASADSTRGALAAWEAGQEAEQAGAWGRARDLYRAVAARPGSHASASRFRLGLIHLADAMPESALAAWAGDTSRAATFWSAVVRRRADPAAADSILRRLAAAAGYDFYAAAARETLGIAAWPGRVAVDSCGDAANCASLSLARALLVLSEARLTADPELLRADALTVISRWIAGDPRVSGVPGAGRDPGGLLAAARLAYGANRTPLGIQAARNAAARAAGTSEERGWAIAPWMFPVAFDSLFQALPEQASATELERALVLAVTWQESKFETSARSRSNALGLMQLKLPAAIDAARWLGEPRPTEARLHDPRLSLRYGEVYLRRMIERFDGHVSLGLAAYNAGASRIPAVWREWIRHGGEALAAELVPYTETRDYVKRILGVRQAYRELRPSSAPR